MPSSPRANTRNNFLPERVRFRALACCRKRSGSSSVLCSKYLCLGRADDTLASLGIKPSGPVALHARRQLHGIFQHRVGNAFAGHDGQAVQRRGTLLRGRQRTADWRCQVFTQRCILTKPATNEPVVSGPDLFALGSGVLHAGPRRAAPRADGR